MTKDPLFLTFNGMKLGLVAGLILGSFLMASLPASQAAAPKEVGLAVGQKAPAFSLTDQKDQVVSLESVLKKGPVALVFYRSADW